MQVALTYVEAEALLKYLDELIRKWPPNAPAGQGGMWSDEQKAVYRAFRKLDRAALYEFKSYAGV